MSDACVCDYDYDDGPDVYAKSERKARKRYRCYECAHHVEPGETYEHVSSLYDGSWQITRTCCRCLDARKYIEAHAPCFCWAHGNMLDDARDTANQYGHESAGFYIGAMKRVLRAERGRPQDSAPSGAGG